MWEGIKTGHSRRRGALIFKNGSRPLSSTHDDVLAQLTTLRPGSLVFNKAHVYSPPTHYTLILPFTMHDPYRNRKVTSARPVVNQ